MAHVNVDVLAAEFARASSLSHVNDTLFSLEYDPVERMVVSRQFIPKGTRIGYVAGIPTYIWDITHAEYMFVNDEQVLDVSNLYPRPITTMIRNENDTWNHANSIMYVENDDDRHETMVSLYATADIRPGDEIVYAMDRYF